MLGFGCLLTAGAGNGITDAYTMTLSYYDMTCTPASVEPIFDIGTCVGMKSVVSTHTDRSIKNANYADLSVQQAETL
jgi:hypothetical protein